MTTEELAKLIENIVIDFVIEKEQDNQKVAENLNNVLDVLLQVLVSQLIKRMACHTEFVNTNKNEILKTVKKFLDEGADQFFDFIYEQIIKVARENQGNVLSIV